MILPMGAYSRNPSGNPPLCVGWKYQFMRFRLLLLRQSWRIHRFTPRLVEGEEPVFIADWLRHPARIIAVICDELAVCFIADAKLENPFRLGDADQRDIHGTLGCAPYADAAFPPLLIES